MTAAVPPGSGTAAGQASAGRAPSPLHFTYDGCMALQCFADDPEAEFGDTVAFVDPGDSMDFLTRKIREHQAEHGCAAALAAREPDAADGHPPSPEPDGTIVIGPQCFASADRDVISWRGINYYPFFRQPGPQPAPELARLRDGIAALAEDLEHSAKATAPSKKSAIEETVAERLRILLEGK